MDFEFSEEQLEMRRTLRDFAGKEILPHAAAWRLLDLSESNGRPVDLVVASKFPTYFVRHPCKVAWLIHQYRAAYELCATFDRASANGPSYVADPLWAHASGRQCFPLVAKDLNADRAR